MTAFLYLRYQSIPFFCRFGSTDQNPSDVLTQVPSNMIIGKVRPSYYICLVTSLWGILSMSQGFTKNFAQLASVRFILGLVEGMFAVGIQYFIESVCQMHVYLLVL